jgi:hypothetical protein
VKHILLPVRALRLLLAYNIFFTYSKYLFTESMGSFVLYEPFLSCKQEPGALIFIKQEPGALIFIKHGVALSHILNLAVFNVPRLSTHPLGDVSLLTFPHICVGC